VVEVSPRVAHGSYKRVNLELERLAYKKPNLSAIERQNGTARTMRTPTCSERAWPSDAQKEVEKLWAGSRRWSTTSVVLSEG
jgi:hypothetical protein